MNAYFCLVFQFLYVPLWLRCCQFCKSLHHFRNEFPLEQLSLYFLKNCNTSVII